LNPTCNVTTAWGGAMRAVAGASIEFYKKALEKDPSNENAKES
jgi:hypothetical protein